MSKPDYDDPAVVEQWCVRQRETVTDYLRSENLDHGGIGNWPAWEIVPIIAIWAIQSLKYPGSIGW
jgi:hypothetical protein